MLLEEFVTERVRTQERAAHTRELEQLRIIQEDDGGRHETGWLARRRAARADARAHVGAQEPVGERTPVEEPAHVDVQPHQEEPARERELQHAGR